MDSSTLPIVLERRSVKSCHIWLPKEPKPIGGIVYADRLYSYVRFYSDLESALRGWERLIQHGNIGVLTQTPKGFVLWVFEAEARKA